MATEVEEVKTLQLEKDPSNPPGKIKIADALKALLKEKDFNSITTVEIAKTSGVNEALIYRYFGDKRGLLHHVLSEYLKDSETHIQAYLEGTKGTLNKLKKVLGHTFDFYDKNRVFAKILLIEVRNFPGYFESETYRLAKNYSLIVLNLIKEGIENGEIRNDISPWHMMQTILGSIEHLILPSLIFDRKLDADLCTENLSSILFGGTTKR